MNTAIISYRPPQLRGTIGPNVYTQKEEKVWFNGRKIIIAYNIFMKDSKDPVMTLEKIVDGYLFQRVDIILSEFYNNTGLPAEKRFFVKTIENEYKTWYLCYSPIKFAFQKKCEENTLKLKELYEKLNLIHEELKLQCNESRLNSEKLELKLNESRLKFQELKLKSEYDESSEKFTKEDLIIRFASFIFYFNILAMSILLSLAILSIKNRNLKLGKI